MNRLLVIVKCFKSESVFIDERDNSVKQATVAPLTVIVEQALSLQPAVGRATHGFCTGQPEPLTVSSQAEGIRTVTLNNPKKRNALSLAMLDSLYEDILRNSGSQDLRVIILKANGPVFSAGHDLKELTSKEGLDYHRRVFDKCTDVMTLVQDIPIPVIAQVNGLATAAGCQLVASCDVVVASDSSRFATPGVSVGLFCSTPAVAIARAVPRKVAMEMLLTGQPISAEKALQFGLVSRVVRAEELEEEVLKIAHRICETSRSVVAMGKRTFYQQVALDRDSAYKIAVDTMVENTAFEDAQEGIKAFIEKRHPTWSHTSKKAH